MTLSKSSPLSLKGVKYSVWASEETHAFEATVYLDGEKAMKVTNDGKGGANYYYGMKGQSRPSFNGMYDACKESALEFVTSKSNVFFPHLTDEQFKSVWSNAEEDDVPVFAITDDTSVFMWSDKELLDFLIVHLLNEHLSIKEMKRQLKAKVTFFDKSDGSIYTIKVKPTEENLAYYKRVHEKESEEKEWVWMNDLPEDNAFLYWRMANA